MSAATYDQTTTATSETATVAVNDGGKQKSSKGWLGRTFALAVSILTITLKLAEYGAHHGWSWIGAFPFLSGIAWQTQWREIALIALEGAAQGAVVSLAFTYIFISNSFTTNISNRIVNKVQSALAEKAEATMRELRDEVAGFRQLLELRQADAEHLKLYNDFFARAEASRVKELEDRLATNVDIQERAAALLATIAKELARKI